MFDGKRFAMIDARALASFVFASLVADVHSLLDAMRASGRGLVRRHLRVVWW